MKLFDAFLKKKMGKKEFKCQKCKKVLNKKYLHANQICANCFSENYSPRPVFNSAERTYKFDSSIIIAPKDEHFRIIFNTNKNNFEKPIFFSNGKMKEDLIHLGTYWLSSLDYEQVTLRKADSDWYVCSVTMCPAYSDASNGEYIETLLDRMGFKKRKITDAEDFLKHFLNGNCETCIELALNNTTTMLLIDEICKNLYFVKPEELWVIPLYGPFHVGETAHGISLLKKEGRFYLKHSELYAKPGSTDQYQESIGKLPEEINTVSKLYSYITVEYGRWISFHEQSNDQTPLSSLFLQPNSGDGTIKSLLSTDD